MIGLAGLANKQPVVSTYGSDALGNVPAEVCAAYDWHAATYVEQPPLAELRSTFVARVLAGQTPKACLVAPFGYGKTATAIGIWESCRRDGLLAVPPISCTSFPELARAVRDWLVFVHPGSADHITRVHEQFLASSAQALASRDERDFGIPFELALAANRDKLERGYLDFEDVSVNLLAFLEQATAIAKSSGHGGLVVIVDEFQQLIGNARRGALVALRQLVWGLRTRELALGLIITMDTDTESLLADRAGDILHRIKDDGLYLNLKHVYDRGFPRRLWNQYATALGLDGWASDAIDKAALESLGQLCEREDLSNGPRMVVNAFQLAAARANSQPGASYTSLQLVDDMLSGVIRFAGDRLVLPTVLGELLTFPYFERSPDLAATLKLLAAFPRGCPVGVAEQYGLGKAWRQVAEELRGEIVTEMDEGLTLVELQRVGRPANRLNVLLRRYWMQITDLQLFNEDACQALIDIALPLLFPSKKHDLSGWSGVDDVRLSPESDYCGVIEGTSSTRFPMRRIGIKVAPTDGGVETSRLEPNDADCDVTLIFRVSLDPSAEPALSISPDSCQVVATLALGRPSASGLQGGLAWIEHYLRPQPISAALVLSLLRYLAREQDPSSQSRDHVRIEDAVSRLRSWLLAEMLPLSAFQRAGVPVLEAGRGGLQELLFILADQRWPDYHPLAGHQHWASLLSDYEGALRRVPPAVRVGLTSFKGSKTEIAELFGQARHAGFESRAKLYGGLLRVEEWGGEAAEVTFTPHVAESQLVTYVRHIGQRPRDDAYSMLRAAGYAAAEASTVLRLATTRGLVTEDGNVLRVPRVPSFLELAEQLRNSRVRAAQLGAVSSEFVLELDSIENDLQEGVDIQETAWRLQRLEELLARNHEQLRQAVQARVESGRRELLDAMQLLYARPCPETPTELTHHLRALYARLEHDRIHLAQATNNVLDVDAPAPEDLTTLAGSVRNWGERALLTERWGTLAERLGQVKMCLLRLRGATPALTGLSSELMQLLREARALLSTLGEDGLREVGRLELAIGELEHRFRASEDERTLAFERVSERIAQQLQALLHLTKIPELSHYEPGDDKSSFIALAGSASAVASRGVALWNLELVDGDDGKGQKLIHAKLRSDISSTAQRAANPTWLLRSTAFELSNASERTIRSLRQRVDKHSGRIGNASSARRVAETLASLPPGPTDISLILERLDGATSQEKLLLDLFSLHLDGSLRLLLDVPIDAEV